MSDKPRGRTLPPAVLKIIAQELYGEKDAVRMCAEHCGISDRHMRRIFAGTAYAPAVMRDAVIKELDYKIGRLTVLRNVL